MKKSTFRNLREVKKNENFPKLEIGDIFLYGENMISQKNKEDIRSISYFVVTEIRENGNILYEAKFDNLED